MWTVSVLQLTETSAGVVSTVYTLFWSPQGLFTENMLTCCSQHTGAANDINYGSVAMTAGQHAQHYVLDLHSHR